MMLEVAGMSALRAQPMFTRMLALMTVAMTTALALEMVFGVHLGIEAWMHRVFGAAQFSILPHL